MLTDLMRSTAAKPVKNAARRYTFRFHSGILVPKRVLSKWKKGFYTLLVIGNAAKRVRSASINAFRSEYILIFYPMGDVYQVVYVLFTSPNSLF